MDINFDKSIKSAFDMIKVPDYDVDSFFDEEKRRTSAMRGRRKIMKKIICAAAVVCLCAILFAGAKAFADKANGSSSVDRLAEMIKAEINGSTDRKNAGEFFVTTILTDKPGTERISLDDIALVGRSILITKDEISDGERFYLAGGDTQKEAHEKAVKYYKEYDALYVRALKAGFDADDEEVKSYVESLREMSKTAANSEDVMKIISAYPSEDDYWKYMQKVYRKQLPVQKYVASLEKSFSEKTGIGRGSMEFAEAWEKEFERIKAEAAKEENFTDSFTGADLTGFLAAET